MGRYNCYRLKKLIDPPQTNFNLALYYDNDATFDESITIQTDDSSTSVQRPTLYVEYKDLPPVLSNFTVRPAVDTLTPDYNFYNLTTENLNAVEFNWNEENADDVWYRMLFVDTVPIADKYHGAVTYFPLNEPMADLNAVPTGTTAYNRDTGNTVSIGGALTVGSDVRMVPYGQGGWGMKFANSTDGKLTYTASTALPAFINQDAYTIVLHWTPSSDDDGVEAYLITSGTPSYDTGEMEMYKNTDNKIVFKVPGTISMTGNKVVKCDGETPVSIIISYDKNRAMSTRRCIMFLDGEEADHDDGNTNITTGPITLGGYFISTSTDRGTTGVFEELIIYDKAYDVVSTPNRYIYNTRGLEDISTNLITHSALLIAADYHNFRGTSKYEIGTTSATTWRTTIA